MAKLCKPQQILPPGCSMRVDYSRFWQVVWGETEFSLKLFNQLDRNLMLPRKRCNASSSSAGALVETRAKKKPGFRPASLRDLM